MPKDYFKKTLAGIFAVAIVASATPLAPFAPLLDSISITASATAAPASYFDYKIENGEAIITSYNGPDNIDLEIPSEIEGKPVTKLDWFLDAHYLNKIIVPDTVKTIGGFGFLGQTYGAGGAEEIVIPASVTSIVAGAFDYLVNPVVYYGGSKERWQEINEDESVTELRMHYYDGTLQGFSYTYDDATEGLKITGYSGTDTDVVIPAEIAGAPVTSIGDRAFNDCAGLTSVTIPDSVTSIGNYAFYDCTELTSVTIGNSVTSIGKEAFKYCENLSKVSIPDSVTSIGNYAFDRTGLTSVTIPDSVTNIGECAFRGCPLTSVTIGNSVTSISADAFFYCEALTEITIPDSVTSIGKEAFGLCSELKNVYYTGSESDWESVSIDDGNDALKNATITYVKAAQKILDSELTWEIDENGVLTITGDDTAFPDCVDNFGEIRVWCDEIDKVTKIVFDTPNLTAIGTAAFINFTALESVELPDTVETIGHQAFRNCKELDTVTIPSSVTSIGINSFNGCASLKSISIPESVTSISDYTFASCSLLASVKMGSKVESIGKSAFDGCANLKSIEIPDSVTSIGNYSFSGCSALTSVKIGKGVASIGSQVFSGCIGLTSITFPNSVTSIGAQVCSGCTGLTSITFGSSVANIGMGALYNCSSLTSISFNGDMPNAINTNAFVSIGTVETPVSLFYPTDNQTWDGIEEAVHNKQWNGGYFEAMTAVIKGYSVSYNGDITINFHYLLSDSYKNGYVEFSDGTQVIASVSAFEVKDANGYYVFPISMPAKNMYDEITAQFYDANDVAIGDAVTFKMADYLSAVKEAAPNTACAAFVDSFLEYGAQAAAYFGVTGAPAGKTYSDSDFASISNTLEANYASIDNMGDTFVGATLLLKSTPKLRLYYSETFTGAEQNELNPDLFYTEKEIAPTKFGTEDLNGYSVYNYIYKALNSDDESLKAICTALYNMSKAIPTVG